MTHQVLRIAHFTERLLCVNIVYPDGLRFYDFQILSSGFLVKFFSRVTSRPHLASVHMLLIHILAKNKEGCVFPMIVCPILPRAEFGLNYHWKDAPHFNGKRKITAPSLSSGFVKFNFRSEITVK